MSTLQLAILTGATVGLGAALIIWRLAPAQPDLATALDRLAPERGTRDFEKVDANGSLPDRLGIWVQRTLPAVSLGRTPVRELAMLRIPVHRYYGEKALFFLLGVLFPPVLTALCFLFGFTPPVVLPLGASLALGVALSFLPDYNARSDAKAARVEFSHALAAYVDLVALERLSGSGTTQAMELAAEVGDSWVFQRLREELARARWSGTPPWDSLTELSVELGLPELGELADIMRLSGEEGATVYTTLRARSSSLRNALLSNELAKANADGERMSLPVAALSLVFLLLTGTPAVLSIMFSG